MRIDWKTGACWLLVAGLSACGGGGGSSGPISAGARSAATRGGDGANVAVATLALSDALFHFDPTLDPSKTADQNAQAIDTQITGELSGCGSVSTSGTDVTVDFGSPPGCTLTGGLTVSGSLTASVATASGLMVALSLTDVVVNGTALGGTVNLQTGDGTAFTISADITTSTEEVVVYLQTSVSGGVVTFTGTLNVTPTSGTAVTVLVHSLTWKPGECYPDGGTVQVAKGKVSAIVTFDAKTPTTGNVTVSEGRAQSTMALPAHGSCPS